MNTYKFIFLLFFLLSGQKVFAADKLLQSSDFTYLGAFKVPQDDLGGPQYHGLSYGGRALTFNPNGNGGQGTLFIVGHVDDQMTTELSIPAPVKSSNLSSLNTASALQNLSDITEGNRNKIGANGSTLSENANYIGGLLVYGNKLIGSVYNYYDGLTQAVKSHFTSGLNLSASNDFSGMFQVGAVPSQAPQAGFMAGPMATVPINYQSLLGGPVLTGQGFLAITSRSSYGPAAFAFDPARLGIDGVVNASPLVYYDDNITHDHATLGWWQSDRHDQYTSTADYLGGMVFPAGSKTLLFFGKHGSGISCYGPATSDSSNAHFNSWLRANSPNGYNCGSNSMSSAQISDGDSCCYDPTNSDKGTHAYPYHHFVWAYNADDLAAAKTGTYAVTQTDFDNNRFFTGNSPNNTTLSVGSIVKPWNVVPYSSWNLDTDLDAFGQTGEIFGAAYDLINQKIYISQGYAQGNGYPLIHVYKLNLAAPAPISQTYNINNFIALFNSWLHTELGNVSDINMDNAANAKDLGIMMSKWN